MTTITELTTEIELQLQRLSIVQDEIGYSDKVKQEKANDLLASVKAFVQGQIDKVILEKQEIGKEAENIQKAILSFKKLMGEFASNKVALDPSQSLQVNLSLLQQEQVEVQQRYNQRLAHVEELYIQLESLKSYMQDFVNTDLLMSEQIDVSSLATNALEEEIQRCQNEYTRRREYVEEGVKEISNLFVMLGIHPDTAQDQLIEQYYHATDKENKLMLCNQLVSSENQHYIEIRIEQLHEMKHHIELRKEEITTSIKHLWNRLQLEDHTCENFLMENRGLTRLELQRYEDELARLLVLKQERVGDFITTAREELVHLWDQLYYSEAQRKQFQPAFTHDFTDSVLELHENEISRLQLEVEDSKYILERIEKHMKLKNEVQEFEATTSDPNRLFGKGQRDPGRLLREEKFRKRISRELPKVTKELEGSLLEYEAMKNHPFLVYGKPYYDVIYQQEIAVENTTNRSFSQENEKLPSAPKTPKRGIETRQPMTSPRAVKSVRRLFNTPQPNRVKSFNFTNEPATTTAAPAKFDVTHSILHQVRENNMKKHKQKVIKRGHIFDDDDDDDEEEEDDEQVDENKAPISQKKTHRKRIATGSQSESDDGIYLGIFDDGPDLSDMSDLEDDA